MEITETAVDPYADPRREAESAIWRNDSLSGAEMLEAIRALAVRRARTNDDTEV